MELNSTRLSSRMVSYLLKQEYPIYAFLGLFGTIVGTILAILLIPENFYIAGELFPSALALTLGLAFSPFLACCRNFKSILRAESLIVLSPIYWLLLDLLQGAYNLTQINKVGVEGAFLAIGLFVCGVWISALFNPWLLPKAVVTSAQYILLPNTIFKLILIFFLLGIFKYSYPCRFDPIKMLYYLGENRWAAPWSRGSLGGWDAFLDHLSYFGYLLPTLTTLLALRGRKLNGQLIISIMLSLIMSAFISQGGGRRVIGFMYGAAILFWTLEQKKLKISNLLALILSITLLLSFMQTMLEYRNVGFQALFQVGSKEKGYKHLHVDDNFLRLGQITELVPKSYPYVYEQQIVYVLVRPIPRVFWPEKPVNPGFSLPEVLGKSGVSLSSSAIGEWYLSFGWLGVFLGGLIYGRLANSASTLLTQNSYSVRSLVYSLLIMTLFAGVRSMQDLVLMSYTLLAWMGVTWLFLGRSQIEHISGK